MDTSKIKGREGSDSSIKRTMMYANVVGTMLTTRKQHAGELGAGG
jgi:hypothetical protein